MTTENNAENPSDGYLRNNKKRVLYAKEVKNRGKRLKIGEIRGNRGKFPLIPFFIIIFAGKIDMIYMLSVNNNVK